jgi:hypothetical protein
MTTPQPYIKPVPNGTPPLPRGLSLTQFIQTLFVGISGLPGSLVRPLWQPEPPEQPDINVDWMGIGIQVVSPNIYLFIGVNAVNAVQTQRHELLEVTCHIYGPNAIDTAGIIVDGFQIPTNLSALFLANMGMVETSTLRHVPDLINERWFDRIILSVFLRREIQRVYPVLTITSASGTIYIPDANSVLPFGVDENVLSTQGGNPITTQNGEPISI